MTGCTVNRRFLFCGGIALSTVPAAVAASPVTDAVDALGDAQFIAIGERHDNPAHHRLQAELVTALMPSGLAFEMLTTEQAERATQLRREGVPSLAIGENIEWDANGWPDWALYAPILDAAPRAKIYGGALSRGDLQAVYATGAEGLPSIDAARFGLNVPLDAVTLVEMLDEQFAAHCDMIEREKLGAMVEVQRAWDAAYADALWRAGQGRGRGVLICGNAHARLDRGAPSYLRRAYSKATVASVGMMETGDDPVAAGQFTVTLNAAAPDRDDPCKKMREAMQKG